MERKIGEIFKYNGEWFQCILDATDDNCNNCFFQKTCSDITGTCSSIVRSEGKSVYFKKLEKVGEPFFVNIQGNNVLKQRYKLYEPKVTLENYWYRIDGNFISIEVKQKEDMEENKLNLKPFDLEKAKAGKPVCTRDGRKARIICFDAKGDLCPIIALVEENGIEAAYHYDQNGQNAYNKCELDLMMLHEKKSGWANIVKGSDGCSHMGRGIFQSKEAAETAIKAFISKLIDTIKVEWYE